jgi:hypothetical protein
MKTKLFTFLVLAFSIFFSLTSCNDFKLDERMLEANFLVHGGEYNKHDSTTRRAWLTLMVKGLNEDAYVLDYTIDGKAGSGANALYIIDEQTSTLVYNSQKFIGSEYMSETMFSGVYDGNFPSGSATTLRFLDDRSGRHPSTGSVSFLSPKLPAGKHTIEYTVTNSYGDTYSGSREFEIKARSAN